MGQFILVSGLPGSGKSTLGKALASALDVPFLDKDWFLERLFETRGVGDSTWRSELSRQADRAFLDAAGQMQFAVLTSWWKHPQSIDTTGTATDWLTCPGNSDVIEIYCRASPRLCFDRFTMRLRHPGHLDERWKPDELMDLLERQSRLGALQVGPLIEIETDRGRQLATIVSEVVERLLQLGWRV